MNARIRWGVLDVVARILCLTEERCCDNESSKHMKTECGQGVCCHVEDEVSSRVHVQSDSVIDGVLRSAGKMDLCNRGGCWKIPEVKVRAD